MRKKGENELTMRFVLDDDVDQSVVTLLNDSGIRIVDEGSRDFEVFFQQKNLFVHRLDGEKGVPAQSSSERWMLCAMNGDYWHTQGDYALRVDTFTSPEQGAPGCMQTIETPLCQRSPGKHLSVLCAIALLETVLAYWLACDEYDEQAPEEDQAPSWATLVANVPGRDSREPPDWKMRINTAPDIQVEELR